MDDLAHEGAQLLRRFAAAVFEPRQVNKEKHADPAVFVIIPVGGLDGEMVAHTQERLQQHRLHMQLGQLFGGLTELAKARKQKRDVLIVRNDVFAAERRREITAPRSAPSHKEGARPFPGRDRPEGAPESPRQMEADGIPRAVSTEMPRGCKESP